MPLHVSNSSSIRNVSDHKFSQGEINARSDLRNTTMKIYSIFFQFTNIVFFVIIAKADVEKLLKDSGVTSDSDSLDTMMSKLEGKSLPDLIREGSSQLASMPSGGAAPAGGAAAGAGAAEE